MTRATKDALPGRRYLDLQRRAKRSTRVLENSAARALAVVREIARISADDGLVFDADHATAEVIRDEDMDPVRGTRD